MSRIARWMWPVRPAAAVALFVATFVATIACCAPLFDWQPSTWGRFDAIIRERSPLVAMPLALIAAWAGRPMRRGNLVFAPESSRERTTITFQFVTRMLLPVALGMLPVLVVAAVHTTSASAGHLSALTLLGTLAAVLCSIPLGFVLGATLPTIAWPVTTVLAAMAIFMVPLAINEFVLLDTGLASRSLAIMWGLSIPDAGSEPSGIIGVIRFSYFVFLALTAVAFYCGASVTRAVRTKIKSGTFLLVPVAVLAITTLLSPRLPLIVPDNAKPDCATTEGTQVCVSQEHASLLPALTALAKPMLAVPTDRTVTVIEEKQTVSIDFSDLTDVDLHTVALSPKLPPSRDTYIDQSADQIAAALTGDIACQKRMMAVKPGPGSSPATSASLLDDGVRQRFATLAGAAPITTAIDEDTRRPAFAPSYAPLAALDAQEFTDWYRQHVAAIRSCTLTEADLP